MQLPDVDAVMVDLDIGEVRLPTNSELPELPSPFRERLVIRLQMVCFWSVLLKNEPNERFIGA